VNDSSSCVPPASGDATYGCAVHVPQRHPRRLRRRALTGAIQRDAHPTKTRFMMKPVCPPSSVHDVALGQISKKGLNAVGGDEDGGKDDGVDGGERIVVVGDGVDIGLDVGMNVGVDVGIVVGADTGVGVGSNTGADIGRSVAVVGAYVAPQLVISKAPVTSAPLIPSNNM